MYKEKFVVINSTVDSNEYLGWNVNTTYIIKDNAGFITNQYKFVDGEWREFYEGFNYSLPETNVIITDEVESAEDGYTIGGGTYRKGKYEVSLKAFPYEDKSFLKWQKDGIDFSEDDEITIDMENAEDATYTAFFE